MPCKNHFAKKCNKVSVYAIESEDELEEISTVRVEAIRQKAVFTKMLAHQRPVRFQMDCGTSASILPSKFVEGKKLSSCSQSLLMWKGSKVKPIGSCALPVLNPKNNEKYKVKFLIIEEDLTPFLGLNVTEKMKLLTVHKDNFVNVVENHLRDMETCSTRVWERFLESFNSESSLNVNLWFSLRESVPARKCPFEVEG